MVSVLTGCITLTCSVLALGEGKCPPGRYRGHGTGTCLPCSDICQHGLDRGRTCRRNCPDYSKRGTATNDKILNLAVAYDQPCPSGSYYDSNLPGCDSCSSICQYHLIQRTTSDCKIHCPKEYTDSLKKDVPEVKSYVGEIVFPVVGVLAITGIVVIVILIRRKSNWSRNHSPSSAPAPEVIPLHPSTDVSEPSPTPSNEYSTGDMHHSSDATMGHPDLPLDARCDMTGSY